MRRSSVPSGCAGWAGADEEGGAPVGDGAGAGVEEEGAGGAGTWAGATERAAGHAATGSASAAATTRIAARPDLSMTRDYRKSGFACPFTPGAGEAAGGVGLGPLRGGAPAGAA